jgi:hypothetical protein
MCSQPNSARHALFTKLCFRMTKICITSSSLLLAATMSAQISITSYGAKPDGATDNTAAISKAFAYATAHQGTKITFPCSTGDTYLIRSPITFPAHTTIEGDNAVSCRILYQPSTNPGNVAAAFSFVGSNFVTVRDIVLQTGSSYPPAAITQMGGTPGAAGQHIIENASIRGFATKALSYSIGSEVNTWRNVYWEYNGGGATYGFYTSAQDDLGICPKCTTGSNLSLFFSANSMVIFGNDPFTAISDKIGGGTGDHYFTQNYIGLNNQIGSIGFEFSSGELNQGGPNSVIHVADTRIENGGYGFYFRKASQGTLYNVDVQDVTWASFIGTTGFFAYGDPGLALSQFRMTHNVAHQSGITGPSSFDSLLLSEIEEHYGPITVRSSAINNTLIARGSTTFTLPSNCSGNTVLKQGVWSTQ